MTTYTILYTEEAEGGFSGRLPKHTRLKTHKLCCLEEAINIDSLLFIEKPYHIMLHCDLHSFPDDNFHIETDLVSSSTFCFHRNPQAMPHLLVFASTDKTFFLSYFLDLASSEVAKDSLSTFVMHFKRQNLQRQNLKCHNYLTSSVKASRHIVLG